MSLCSTKDVGVRGRMAVDFTLDIYGGGVLDTEMREEIQRRQLGSYVHMMGFIPFEDLVERTRTSYDIWLCCHPQGDPSGAYLEDRAGPRP